MSNNQQSFVLVQPILVDYRLILMRELKNHLGDSLTVYAGDKVASGSQLPVEPTAFDYAIVKNRFLFNRLLWQQLPIQKCIACSSIIVELNPRSLNTWLIALLRRAMGKPVIMWGHAWPRDGRDRPSDLVRGALRRLATDIVAYTDGQAVALSKLYPQKRVLSAPNALYSDLQMVFNETATRDSILYVGRVVSEKKVDLLLEAFEQIAEGVPWCRLDIVGEGECLASLREKSRRIQHSTRISFHGHQSDPTLLRDLYAHAVVSVAPGTAGLNIVQSLGFGVPIVVASDEAHGPEVEALEDGINSVTFQSDNVNDLALKIEMILLDSESWRNRGKRIRDRCAERYSIESMAYGMISALLGSVKASHKS